MIWRGEGVEGDARENSGKGRFRDKKGFGKETREVENWGNRRQGGRREETGCQDEMNKKKSQSS